MIFLSTETNKLIVKGGDLLSNVEEEGFTRLHCKYTTTSKYLSDWEVHIHKTSYLINNTSAEKLRLLHAINIPLAPEWFEKNFLFTIAPIVDMIIFSIYKRNYSKRHNLII